ncbi:MarR family winged helix-turn-helix transcriptional regulator [Mumia quercus]|uniref:MarR family winged helix-turn-helix transcriptional regulator n=1 Tax=Mumia quercus TaxID=2976125 RepID=UPI0021D1515B|nr:MarR family winged helix-turn-helix transcriptional regulator [Mumia quercus]
MHSSNVWAASVLAAADRLAAGLPAGLGMRDLEALTLVATHPGATSDWLRTRIALTQSGTVRLVDRLERLGLVRRQREGRQVGLTVTPAGRRRLAAWDRARDDAMADAVAGLDGEEREALVTLLSKALLRVPRVRADADRACRTCTWPRCEPACPVDASVTD